MAESSRYLASGIWSESAKNTTRSSMDWLTWPKASHSSWSAYFYTTSRMDSVLHSSFGRWYWPRFCRIARWSGIQEIVSIERFLNRVQRSWYSTIINNGSNLRTANSNTYPRLQPRLHSTFIIESPNSGRRRCREIPVVYEGMPGKCRILALT